jgi:protein O-GlcNAc transferase
MTAESHCQRGDQFARQNQMLAAIAEFRAAIQLNPRYPLAHFFLGTALRIIGQLEQATESYRTAVELQPNYTQAWEKLAEVLTDRRRFAEAADASQHAVALSPTPMNYANLAGALGSADRFDESLAAMSRAAELSPQWSDAQKGLGSVYFSRGQQDDAIAAYRKAIELDPQNAIAHSMLLYMMLFHGGFSPEQLLAEHKQWAAQHTKDIIPLPPPTNDRTIDRRLRVGYISPNFRTQAVIFFILPILNNHDVWEVEIFCYSDVIMPDPWTLRARKKVEEWRDTARLTDEELTHLIRKDQIDILVDLTGHIGDGRLKTFAYKPAPIQISWIGYQATTGLPAMDYFLTDDWADPPGQTERYFVEKLYRLPETFFCYMSPPKPPDVGPLPALSAGYITFGSFNNFAKITPRTLDLWTRLLKAVPNSRLLLMIPASNQVEQRIRDIFTAAEITPDRLQLVHRVSLGEYLDRYNQIDIALDPVPFNGHTTTCDAAWMGCPTVMLAGEIFVYRYGGSVLRNLRLADLIATTEDDYIRIAAELAGDTKRLAEIRRTLRSTMAASPITDAQGFTQNLEKAYRRMWQKWCETQP